MKIQVEKMPPPTGIAGNVIRRMMYRRIPGCPHEVYDVRLFKPEGRDGDSVMWGVYNDPMCEMKYGTPFRDAERDDDLADALAYTFKVWSPVHENKRVIVTDLKGLTDVKDSTEK